ncbi:MAG: PhoH family protein [Calditrichaeota bacterium]|nr:MAG: PhoH family protein [Calditrichota bacterium]
MTKKKKRKVFILDTNVILHDSSCLYQFKDHNIVLPITVLEELDNFKKGNDSLNFHAREFVRTLDKLSGDKIFNGGVKIAENLGKVIIKLEQKLHPDVAINFSGSKPDHLILNTAYWVSKENENDEAILVSKDVNLRMKAKAIGIKAEDYKTDHVRDISDLYTGKRLIENFDDEKIESLYKIPFELESNEIEIVPELIPNEYLILKNGQKSVLATNDSNLQKIKKIDKKTVYGITPRNAEQIFALDALANPDIKLVSLSGKAGTGKTLLALAAALETRRNYRQIFISRPIVPLSNKDIGFLPGDIQSKIGPYMQPLYDNLGVIQNQFLPTDQKHIRVKELLEEDKLVITPLSYIRGRSLVKVYFIVDEAQNLTPHEVKTIITRAGEGTKMIFTGDIFQIDHPYLDTQSNGLSYLIEKMQGQDIYAHIDLVKGERSELAELASNLL